jgi:hypothetical protein
MHVFLYTHKNAIRTTRAHARTQTQTHTHVFMYIHKNACVKHTRTASVEEAEKDGFAPSNDLTEEPNLIAIDAKESPARTLYCRNVLERVSPKLVHMKMRDVMCVNRYMHKHVLSVSDESNCINFGARDLSARTLYCRVALCRT